MKFILLLIVVQSTGCGMLHITIILLVLASDIWNSMMLVLIMTIIVPLQLTILLAGGSFLITDSFSVSLKNDQSNSVSDSLYNILTSFKSEYVKTFCLYFDAKIICSLWLY